MALETQKLVRFLCAGRFASSSFELFYTHADVDADASEKKWRDGVRKLLMKGTGSAVVNVKLSEAIYKNKFANVPLDDGLCYYISDDERYFAVGTARTYPSKPAFQLLRSFRGEYVPPPSADEEAPSWGQGLASQNSRKAKAVCTQYEDPARLDDASAQRVERMGQHMENERVLAQKEQEMSSWKDMFRSPGLRQKLFWRNCKYGLVLAVVILILILVIWWSI
eukprot:tig00000076_g2398.t1